MPSDRRADLLDPPDPERIIRKIFSELFGDRLRCIVRGPNQNNTILLKLLDTGIGTSDVSQRRADLFQDDRIFKLVFLNLPP